MFCRICGGKRIVAFPGDCCPGCMVDAGHAILPTLKILGLPDIPGYRLTRLIEHGGMGEVYEADQTESGRRVALKIVDQTIGSPESRLRFLREGQLAAAVSHPNTVYVFGTEEVRGMPVIVMELVPGSTLKKELDRRGPLPVHDAVDAILQVITGLEAAAEAGVLHRDIKPANCFVTPEGLVKVGDFGLSISILARTEPHLTPRNVALGTPAYASPEQLRGEEIDLRSDIYSTGATLYELLVGHPPFPMKNDVHVVAAVLGKAPPPLSGMRREVPLPLAHAVMRCLEKNRDDRFESYAELRDALLPFSSAAPQPAPLGLRTLASLVDDMIAWQPARLAEGIVFGDFAGRWLTQRTLESFLPQIPFLLLYLAYYAVPEGWHGASVGKALFRLRVVNPDGYAPGIPRAALRALFWVLPVVLIEVGAYATVSAEEYRRFRTHINSMAPFGMSSFGILYIVVSSLASSLLFLTMRLRNGFAGIQDLISGTRVVLRQEAAAHPHLEAAAPPEPSRDAAHLGPYRINDGIGDGLFIDGYDDTLRRHVWLRRQCLGAPAIAESRKKLCRATRLRWIGGVRSAVTNWDAYEEPRGQSLPSLAPHSQPWATMRLWLFELASELEAAGKDGTLPKAVTLAHVWITTDGRAVLLDEAWTNEPMPSGDAMTLEPFDAMPCGERQRFLHAIAGHFLDPLTVPLHARPFLTSLASAKFDGPDAVLRELQSLLGKSARVSPRRRAASLICGPAFFMVGWVPAGSWDPVLLRQDLGLFQFSAVLLLLAMVQLLSLLFFRTTPGQQLFGFAFLNKKGHLAGRWRLFARWGIAWLPFAIVEANVHLRGFDPDAFLSKPSDLICNSLLLLLWTLAMIATIARPECGPHDRLAGTRVVLR